MNKELTVNQLPEPFIYHTKRNHYSEYAHVDTPYSDLKNIENTLKLYDIKVSFKVITHTDGISTCSYCKTKYAGYQDKCTNLVTYYQKKDEYSFKRGNTFKGELIDGRYEYDRVHEVKKDECLAFCNWNLKDEFSRQHRFFNFITWLGSCTVDHIYNEYFSLIPKEKLNELRVNRLEQELLHTKDQLNSVVGALQQIAEKIKNNL